MFFVNDVYGQQHAYSGRRTKVGLRPESVVKVAAPHPLGVGDSAPDQPSHDPKLGSGDAYSSSSRAAATDRQRLWIVRQIMSQPVVHLLGEASVAEALQLLQKGRMRHLPVTSEKGQVIGVISQRDVLLTQARRIELKETTVALVMTREVLTARPDAGIREVARTMLEARVGSLPIVEEGGALVGIVTRSDILRAIVQHAPLELWG